MTGVRNIDQQTTIDRSRCGLRRLIDQRRAARIDIGQVVQWWRIATDEQRRAFISYALVSLERDGNCRSDGPAVDWCRPLGQLLRDVRNHLDNDPDDDAETDA